MSFNPPEGILDIGNATLRVGKLEVSETLGLNQGLQNIVKNNLLITETTSYTTNQKWGLKLPTTWVAEFEVKGHTGKYIDFNFYNENSASNALGYNLTFKDTTMTLRYDGGNPLPITGDTVDSTLSSGDAGYGVATIPTIVGAFRKVNIFFERGVLAVSIDGTRYLYFRETDGYNNGVGAASRVVSATGSAFVNLFIEQNASDSAFKNLRIVNDRFISDKTSNIAFVGGNLGVGVNSPQEALDIRGNMHFNRVSNVSSVSVDSNVVAEYTGPHDRPLRKYPEVAMTSASQGGYVVSRSSANGSFPATNLFNNSLTDRWLSTAGEGDTWSGTTYAGSNYVTDVNGTQHPGTWIQLKMPKQIKLSYVVQIDNNASSPAGRVPAEVKILGTNDSANFHLLKTFTGLSNVSLTTTLFVNEANPYNEYAYVMKDLVAPEGGLDFTSLEFYGHEEGDSSLDTTLKSVYNVPGTQQLEVYYDAKDLTAMPGTVTDLSPNTNNGTVSGDPQVSNGAFVFDGTGDYISSTVTTTTGAGNWSHSFSFWMKADTDASTAAHFVALGTEGDSTSAIRFYGADAFIWYFWGNDIIFNAPNTRGRWIHIVGTYDGGNEAGYAIGGVGVSRKIFINTVETTISSVSGTIGSLNLSTTSTPFRIGSQLDNTDTFKGSIANFRLFSKVLNADQIKELYDYQKDYFLGSRSSVTLYKGHLGIGVTEPSGQLELAGDERLQEYPPGPMGPSLSYETLIPGHGVFCWDTPNYWAGGTIQNFNGSGMYAKDGYTTGWYGPYNGNNGYSGGNIYAGTDFAATSSSGLGFNDANGTRYYGAWTTFKLPYKINLKGIHIDQFDSSDGAGAKCAPEDGVILGSNNGVDWYHVHTFTGLQYGGTAGTSSYSAAGEDVTITCTTDYSQYALVITRTLHYVFTGMIGELKWFGTPGPTTLDKGSLTLGRSLDVPRISRYDVDTETPRPEKLVLDFDTTVNSSPTDISGQGNHGTLVGATYSAADKAFNFDASTEYIDSTLNNTGDTDISVSLWLKREADTTGTVWIIGNPTQTNGQNLAFDIYIAASNHIYLWAPDGPTLLDIDGALQFPVGQWVHLVCTRTGSGSSALKVYIDGVDWTPNMTYSTGSSSLALPANSKFRLGLRMANNVEFTGKISNSKVYNVVLEPSEVQKLYNLGRTGRSMVISDTAVGIGKVPEAQLDVRGNLAVRGDILSTGPNMIMTSGGDLSIKGQIYSSYGMVAPFFRSSYNTYGFDNAWRTLIGTATYDCGIGFLVHQTADDTAMFRFAHNGGGTKHVGWIYNSGYTNITYSGSNIKVQGPGGITRGYILYLNT